MIRIVRAGLIVLTLAAPIRAQEAPIIDVHVHAHAADHQGPPPRALCAPFETFPSWDPSRPWDELFAEYLADPPCDNAIWSPMTDRELRDSSLAVLERRNIFAVVSGSPERVGEWRQAAPDRIIPGLELFNFGIDVSPDSLRRLISEGDVRVLAEVSSQYRGLGPDAPELEPYWSLAEELDIPVGIHIHPGPPGSPYLGTPTDGLHSPLRLEPVLRRHPGLRVYVIHAAWPQLDDMLTLLFTHPQVYVDIGGLVWIHPRADFYRYLRSIVEAGFSNRVMFGSDQMIWPQAIELALDVVNDAPFLTDAQRRAILYENAARFLRLSDEEMARHRGG
jgi:hypothetical protein